MNTRTMAEAARAASIPLAAVNSDLKNKALLAIAEALDANRNAIERANKQDLEEAAASLLAAPLLKRLKFDGSKVDDVIAGIRSLVKLPEPVGISQQSTELDKGLELYRVTCPIGVIGVIFESRPNALVQISTLCLKSSNSVLLKGGSEATHTNRILAKIIHDTSIEAGIPEGWLQLLETRDDVSEMLDMDDLIDLIIPRGSNEFVKYIMDNSNIPVLGHADGICHVYIDEKADPDMAVNIAVDSKCQYVAVCNACETILVHEDAASQFLPAFQEAVRRYELDIRGCEKTCGIIEVTPATDVDWATEYLDYAVSIKVVANRNEAIDHINTYGSGHTDVIVTTDAEAAADFMNLVDSGNVFWNASSRFSDGFRYGLGAEVGISTNKIHARGPVGLEGMLIYKWKLIGHGQIVAPYADGSAQFTHKPLSKPFSMG